MTDLAQRAQNYASIRYNRVAGHGVQPSHGQVMFDGGEKADIKDSTFNNVGGDYNETNVYHGKSPLARLQKLLQGVNVFSMHEEIIAAIGNNKQAGQWLLNHQTYLSWKAGQSESRLLWLSGIPGSGKTVLCSRVIGDLEGTKGPQAAMVFFYCHPGCNPNDVFAGLLHQLLLVPSTDSPAFSSRIQKYQFVTSVNDLPLIDLIFVVSREFRKMFIVIDGLDACDDLKKLLLGLTKLAKWAHVFVSSRGHPVIRSELTKCEKIIISQDNIAKDVRAFVETQVKEIKTRDPNLRKSMLETIVQNAQGMFAWVSYKCKELREALTDHARREALSTVPLSMKGTFIGSLELVDITHRHLLRVTLRLVVCAQWPITSRALAEAIGASDMGSVWDPSYIPSDPKSLIDCSANLLTSVPVIEKLNYDDHWANSGLSDDSWKDNIVENDEIVIAFHKSLKDFLLADPMMLPRTQATFALNPLSAVHSTLAELCLSYLSLLLKGVDRSAGLKPSDHPFAEYAILSWELHMKESKKPRSEFEMLFAAWRNNKAKAGWIPNPVHMAVRLNLPVYRGITMSVFSEDDDEGLTPLHYAVKNSASLDVIDWILKKVKVKDVNQVSHDQHSATPLHLACLYHRDQESVVQRLLLAGADVKAQTKDGRTPLHLLLEFQSPERAASCMQLLLKHGADINSKDFHQRTPLHAFIPRAKQSDVVEHIVNTLIKQGAEVDARDKDGRTPLHMAARGGCPSLLKSLLKNGADPNATDNNGDTAFAMAVGGNSRNPSQAHVLQHLRHHGAGEKGVKITREGESDDEEGRRQIIIDELLDHGALSDGRNKSGGSPLHRAASSGHVPTVLRLLEQGAAIDAVDDRQRTPLHVACDYSSSSDEHHDFASIVKSLLDYKADIAARDQGGETPLHRAATANESVVEYLLERGAEVNARDHRNRTPLYNAARWGRPSIISLLVEKGATVNDEAFRLEAPLHALCRGVNAKYNQRQSKDYEDALSRLVSCGADINARNRHDNTPLIIASENGRATLVERLLKVGAGIDLASVGCSLAEAVYWGAKKEDERDNYNLVVERLVKEGVDVRVVYNALGSPQDIARGAGYAFAVQLMGMPA